MLSESTKSPTFIFTVQRSSKKSLPLRMLREPIGRLEHVCCFYGIKLLSSRVVPIIVSLIFGVKPVMSIEKARSERESHCDLREGFAFSGC